MATTTSAEELDGKVGQNMYLDMTKNGGTKEEYSESNPGGNIQLKEESVQAKLSKKRNTLLNKLTSIENQKFFARKYAMPHIQRAKSHWDYVLEEMQWMAIDVRQELRYKLPFLEGIAQACAEKKMHRDFCKSLSVSDETREVARKVSDQVTGFISSLCPPPPSPLPARASEGDAMDVVEPSLDAADFALVVDRVLATATSLPILPSVVPATHIHTHVQPHSQSHAQRQSSAHSQHAKHPSSFALLPHQVPV
eukprot:gene27770-33540_t